jgi:hypothetical protein
MQYFARKYTNNYTHFKQYVASDKGSSTLPVNILIAKKLHQAVQIRGWQHVVKVLTQGLEIQSLLRNCFVSTGVKGGAIAPNGKGIFTHDLLRPTLLVQEPLQDYI